MGTTYLTNIYGAVAVLFRIVTASFSIICLNQGIALADNGISNAGDTAQVAHAKRSLFSRKHENTQEVNKKGLSFGPLPILSYDEAKGIHFGGLVNIYNFGDGSTYPEPKCYWYLEASAYTGGSQTYIASFDSGRLLNYIRLNVAASLCRDKAMEFFGFNGYQTVYDWSVGNGFYKYDRTTINFKADLKGKIARHLYWDAGYHFNYFIIGDYKSRKEENVTTLYGLYRNWGVFGNADISKAISSAIRAGLIYDSRDYEGVTSRGIMADAHIYAAPEFLGSRDSYVKFMASFRQYLPLYKDRLTFAYRLDYHDFIGRAPWYVLPFYTPGGPIYDNVALGGYRTVRGIMYNRVTGYGLGIFNAELRWTFLKFKFWNQNIGFMLAGFSDGIRTFRTYDISNRTGYSPELYNRYVSTSSPERFHISAGAAFRLILNRNFVLSAEYARCTDRRDGTGVLYLHTGLYF